MREQAVAARKRAFNEKKIQLEQRKRKLNSGFDEIAQESARLQPNTKLRNRKSLPILTKKTPFRLKRTGG